MKKIVISVNPWQTRVAILRDGELQNIYFSSPVSKPLERMFFKGVVSKVLPGIQTAFVDIGQVKAGFLHISEIDRELALQRMSATVELEEIPGKKPRKEEGMRQTLDVGKILCDYSCLAPQFGHGLASDHFFNEIGWKITAECSMKKSFVFFFHQIAIYREGDIDQDKGQQWINNIEPETGIYKKPAAGENVKHEKTWGKKQPLEGAKPVNYRTGY